MKRISEDIKKEALNLRINHRKSIKAISRELSLAKSTVSLWMRQYPLTAEEKHTRYVQAGISTKNNLRSDNRKRLQEQIVIPVSTQLANERQYSSNQKGRIAETAVMFRLAILQISVYKAIFDGEKLDLVIELPNNVLKKIQVKWIRIDKDGRGSVKLTCSNTRSSTRRYTSSEFDCLVGYDLSTDICYIYTQEETKDLTTCVSCSASAAEAWHKLTI